MYKAVPCNCGHKTCKDWHISGVAQTHGVCFTHEQAVACAAMLNLLDMANDQSELLNVLRPFRSAASGLDPEWPDNVSAYTGVSAPTTGNIRAASNLYFALGGK